MFGSILSPTVQKLEPLPNFCQDRSSVKQKQSHSGQRYPYDQIMRSVDKALKLLEEFDESRPEIGLSEMARLSGLDKATAHRMLTTLSRHGFVEQHPQSKSYRLGAGILRLARIREATFPVTASIQPVLEQLSHTTGETAHASLLVGDRLATIGICESPKSIRVYLAAGQILHLHATASGIACLSYMPEDHSRRVLDGGLESFTEYTDTDSASIQKQMNTARELGHACCNQSYEMDVFGIASPIFSASGYACGAIAVATPAHRMTEQLKDRIIASVTEAAFEASRRIGAEPPEAFRRTVTRKVA